MTAPARKTARAYTTAAEVAPAYWMIGVRWRVMATGIQTGGACCMLDQICSAGSGPTRHSHSQDEGLYVAEGSVAFQAGGLEFTAGPGSFIAVPRHTEHSFIVDEEANLLNFYLPAGFDMFLMGAAFPAIGDGLPPAELPMPPEALMKTLSKAYGGAPPTEERSTRPNPTAIVGPAVTTTATARSYSYNGASWSVLADGASTGGSYALFEVTMAPGATIAPHLRDGADEIYYCLEGEAELILDDCHKNLSMGSMGFSPPGTLTALRVSSAARLLIIHTAPGYERLLAAQTSEMNADQAPKDVALSKADGEQLSDLEAEIGLSTLRSWTLPKSTTIDPSE